jgi:hypothetical protein
VRLGGADRPEHLVQVVGREGAVGQLQEAAPPVDVAVAGEDEVEAGGPAGAPEVRHLAGQLADHQVELGAGRRAGLLQQRREEPCRVAVEVGEEPGPLRPGDGGEDLVVLGGVVVGVLERRAPGAGAPVAGHDEHERHRLRRGGRGGGPGGQRQGEEERSGQGRAWGAGGGRES